MSRRDLQGGFTLVEVLVSLFIFALISAGTLGAMTQTFAAKARLDATVTRLSDVAAMRAILRADIEGLTLRPMRDGLGGTERFTVTTQNDALLSFTRLGRSNPAQAPRGQAERVRYVFRDGALIRESLPHENPASLDLWRGRVLLDGLENVEMNYIGRLESLNTDLILAEWTVERGKSGDIGGEYPAIRVIITESNGTETTHLFGLNL